MMLLALDGLVVNCIIGERPEERRRQQIVTIQVQLELPEVACRTDSLADTIDYGVLASEITCALKKAKCQMLERAAQIVMGLCLADKRVRAARVEVVKSGTVKGLRAGRVVLTKKKRGR